jgi:hypothetical protein
MQSKHSAGVNHKSAKTALSLKFRQIFHAKNQTMRHFNLRTLGGDERKNSSSLVLLQDKKYFE